MNSRKKRAPPRPQPPEFVSSTKSGTASSFSSPADTSGASSPMIHPSTSAGASSCPPVRPLSRRTLFPSSTDRVISSTTRDGAGARSTQTAFSFSALMNVFTTAQRRSGKAGGVFPATKGL
ncbi:MAG: hypothetical protein BWY76_00773 [bacterium ADurb.Bin429]|nr:MAG: hypothetical protein BWY76_00773 [bacterium ADurb.Bin429]